MTKSKKVGKKWLHFGLVTNIYYRLFYRPCYLPTFFITDYVVILEICELFNPAKK